MRLKPHSRKKGLRFVRPTSVPLLVLPAPSLLPLAVAAGRGWVAVPVCGIARPAVGCTRHRLATSARRSFGPLKARLRRPEQAASNAAFCFLCCPPVRLGLVAGRMAPGPWAGRAGPVAPRRRPVRRSLGGLGAGWGFARCGGRERDPSRSSRRGLAVWPVRLGAISNVALSCRSAPLGGSAPAGLPGSPLPRLLRPPAFGGASAFLYRSLCSGRGPRFARRGFRSPGCRRPPAFPVPARQGRP